MRVLSIWVMVIVLTLVACQPGSEPVSVGHFFIDNRTEFPLQVEGENIYFGQSPADSVFHFFRFEEDTGGAVAPYHLFKEFKLEGFIGKWIRWFISEYTHKIRMIEKSAQQTGYPIHQEWNIT